MTNNLLEVQDLLIKSRDSVLVDTISFKLKEGSTLGIVGESGSGKSLTSLAIMGLLPKSLKATGLINYRGKNILKFSESDFLKIRAKDVSMIFQEPMTALNPTLKCGKQVSEILLKHTDLTKKEAHDRVIELFKEVDLPRPGTIFESYPHEISGGQKQRVVISMAIACKPDLLIADEPTTALDATVQGSILKLLKKLSIEYGMAMIFISHDLGVVKHVADKLLVMYRGREMEYGLASEIFKTPSSEYTKGLLACKPTSHTMFYRLPVVEDFMNGVKPKLKLKTQEGRRLRAMRLLETKPLLKVTSVDKVFTQKGFINKDVKVNALQKVELDIYKGETLGLVGESGSGKTTLGRILSGLDRVSEGTVKYRGKDVTKLTKAGWKKLHKEVQIIFQDPFSSLNPKLKIGEALMEVLAVQSDLNSKKRKAKALSLLQKVGLATEHFDRYPHEFSGGQRQRVGIARALAVNPSFIVCDESVSALDVSVQAQVLNLLNDLKEEFSFTYLFISHDLAVVKYFADRIVVLQNGKVVEQGLSDELYEKPKEDYTKKLIAATYE